MRKKIDLPTYILLFIIEGSLVAVAFMFGYLYQRWSMAKTTNFAVLNQAYQILEENGYQELPAPKTLEYGMIRGMLQAYNDPFTTFLEPPQSELQSDQLQGNYGGIGTRLEWNAEKHLLLYPFLDSPAQKAGLQEGDRLLSVDTLSIMTDTSLDAVEAALRGPVGSTVRLSIGRSPDYKAFNLSIIRAEVPLPSTTWNLAPGMPTIGVIQVSVIAATTEKEVSQGITELQQRGARYIVLDLRNNAGGLVDAGVNTARLFLKDGLVIQQQYKGKPVISYPVEKPGLLADLPLAVLVNHNTASAAEIIAGALKQHRRAVLIGTPTYGKDTIQLVFDLQDGSGLHVTAARWWVPALEPPLGGKGLQPDIALPDDASNSDYLQAASKSLLKSP